MSSTVPALTGHRTDSNLPSATNVVLLVLVAVIKHPLRLCQYATDHNETPNNCVHTLS